eukprot:COSAG04_NODE_1712_length_5832_cov_8.246991_3_plen_136_part_00
MPSRPEDDEDFGERVDFTFSEMDTNKVGAINYMQLRKWISAQMKADDEVEATGITDEMQKAATDAFAAHKRDDDLLGRDQIADLLSSLDLLKYVPEEVPEPEPEPVEEGLSTACFCRRSRGKMSRSSITTRRWAR